MISKTHIYWAGEMDLTKNQYICHKYASLEPNIGEIIGLYLQTSALSPDLWTGVIL